MMMRNKKKIIFFNIFAALGITAFVCRSRYERKTLTTRFVSVKDKRIDKKIRLAFLSDLHGNSFGANNSELIQCIKDAAPDVVLMGGDMITAKEYIPKDFSQCENLLQGLFKHFPIYYAEGNHEMRLFENPDIYSGWREEFLELLDKYHVKFLSDEKIRLTDNIVLSGLKLSPEFYKKLRFKGMEAGYVKEHLNLSEGDYNIVMAHSPQYMKNYWDEGADLVLSGHFHGGTVVLPLFGPVMSPQLNIHPKYANGQCLSGDKKCITSAGLGTHSINIRINNKPELIIIDLLKEE